MKRIFKSSFILLALLGVMFTSCKKEYEVPPIPVLPVGDVYTIGDLLAMPANTTFDTASVYGIVTADEQSGNLYKTIFIQDRSTGKAIELLMNTSSAARIGDSVRVFLDKNMIVNNYHNLPQLTGKDGKGFNPDGHLIIYPYNNPIEPTTVTIADIKTGNYTAGLVKLENVEFVDQGSAFCNIGENTNRTLKDATGELLVRTSNYANFAYDLLPVGQGSLVAIASVYNNDWQLVIRSKNEMHFEGGEPTPPAPPGEVQHLPYTQNFSSDFGTYTTYNVAGDQTWVIDYSTAKMTGYVSNTYYANEDWLISSPVDLSEVNSAKITMSYIGRYFTKINEEVTLWASTDYSYGSNPTTATWTQIPANLSEGTNWSDFLTAEIDLVDATGQPLVGQNLTVAVKYISSAQKAGTMEIQSISITEGNGDTPPTPPTPGGDLQNMPYSQSFDEEFGTYTTFDVLGPQSWMIDYHTAKMTGFVSGSSNANEDWLISSPVAVTGVNEAKVSVDYAAQFQNSDSRDVTLQVSTDYVFGNSPATATWKQLSATFPNTANWNDFQTVENSLNDFIGQNVTVAVKFTSTASQSRTIEIKAITVQEGHAEGGDTPDPPTPGGDVQNMPYMQSFEQEFGTYTTKDVMGPESWKIDYSTAKMTGYVSQTESHANEDWLISSPVAITGVNDAKMTMVYIGRYFDNINADITIWASANYVFGTDPSTASWTQVPALLTQGSNWTDFTTTEISLSDYVSQTVTLAVKYLSRNSRDSFAGTIEIKSITIEEGSAGGDDPNPPTPGEGSGTFDDPYNVTSGRAHQNPDNTHHPENTEVAWVQGYIVGSVKANHSTVTANADVAWEAPFDLATNVVIADDPDCHEISQCLFVNLPAGKPLREQVNLLNTPDNLGKRLSVLGKLYTYFGQAGLRDSGGTEDDFVLEGYVPPTPPDPEGFFSESFMYGQGDFTIQDVVLPDGLGYVWAHNAGYKCMKASSFVNQTNYVTESWLVSPPIEIPFWNIITLTFEQAVNYASHDGLLSVMVSTDYNGDVTQATWTELNLDSWPAGNNWDFSTSSTTGLSNFMEETVVIGFKYTSTSNSNPAWEIKNLVIF
ncbi:MAG: choice-of-anchor J domain-containing protein [Bacteroidales bacterium]|nr:choice-of-anchor J domain-containing protein [Bacteroidales bacterium]